MGIENIWAWLSGLVGIISFLLAVWDKFPQWKTHLLFVGAFFAGLTVGRVLPIIDKNIIGSPQLVTSIIVLLILFGVSIAFYVMLLKKGETSMAFIGVLLILSSITPSIMNSYSEANFKIPPSDYLKLAVTYENKKDFDNAIKYLDKYKESGATQNEKEQIQKKIEQLKSLQLSEVLNKK